MKRKRKKQQKQGAVIVHGTIEPTRRGLMEYLEATLVDVVKGDDVFRTIVFALADKKGQPIRLQLILTRENLGAGKLIDILTETP